MKITVTLHCEGFPNQCSAAISTGARNHQGHVATQLTEVDFFTTYQLLEFSARNSTWDTVWHHTETTTAYCPDCARRRHSHAAQQLRDRDNHTNDPPPCTH